MTDNHDIRPWVTVGEAAAAVLEKMVKAFEKETAQQKKRAA